MLTHLLSSQVGQRFSSCRSGRSEILVRLSSQLQRFHGVQVNWQKQRLAAQGAVSRAADEIHHRDQEIDRVLQDTAAVVDDHRNEMAHTCRDMCAVVDQRRLDEQLDSEKLQVSRKRLEEQRGMVHRLVDHNHALQDSLDRTTEKYDEVSVALASRGKELELKRKTKTADDERVVLNKALGIDPALSSQDPAARGQTAPLVCSQAPPAPGQQGASALDGPALKAARSRAQVLHSELDKQRAELAVLKAHCGRIQSELIGESGLSLRLENFVRRVASSPSSTVRCGGGFAMDSAAKREAEMLLKAAESGTPLPQAASPAPSSARSPEAEAPATVMTASSAAAEIMKAADRLNRNGQLAITELQAFLGSGTVASRRFGGFLDWLMSDNGRRFRRFDQDHDGTISMSELQQAVASFLGLAAVSPGGPPNLAGSSVFADLVPVC